MKSKNNAEKKVFDNKGNVAVRNLNANLLEQVVKKMKRTDVGICVARQFVYGTQYPMLIINACSETEGPESHVDVAIWTNSNDADFYVVRSFIFKRTENGIKKWEDFCEQVSGSSAIWERDLIGNFFIGHITKTKTIYDKQVFFFENLAVDRFLGRIDPKQVHILPKNNTPAPKVQTSRMAMLLDDDEED